MLVCSRPVTGRNEEPPSAAARLLPEKRSLSPDSPKLTSDELRALVRVPPLAGQTPRQIKRFTNLYRLVKVGLGERDLESFLDVSGNGPAGFQSAAIALAIVTGAPRATLEMFQLIQSSSDGLSLDQLARHICCEDGDKDPDTDPLSFAERQLVLHDPEVKEAARRLWSAATAFPDVTTDCVKPWISTVARYSFAGADLG